jgi:hypothetical protein
MCGLAAVGRRLEISRDAGCEAQSKMVLGDSHRVFRLLAPRDRARPRRRGTLGGASKKEGAGIQGEGGPLERTSGAQG